MKKALKWSFPMIGVLFLVFCFGLFFGRRSNIITPGSSSGNNTLPSFYDTPNVDSKEKLNINTATVKELQLLPGIGQTLAERIVAYRTENGPFKSIRDLQKVEGIGEKKLSEIIEIICVEDSP